MTRLLLRFLNAPGLIFLVAIGVAIQTSLFSFYPLMYLQPDVVLLAVVWCALRREFIEGGIITLILGNITEIHTTAPSGLFLISYMAVYLMVRVASKVVVLPGLSSLVILSLFSSVFWKLSGLGVLYLLGFAGSQWRHTLALLLPGAVMVGITSIWIYRGLDWFDFNTFKSARAKQILEDELQIDGEGY